MSTNDLNINLEALFILLGNATISLPSKYSERAFQDMAYKLIEWYNVSRVDLRNIMSVHGFQLEELCHECNTNIKDEVDPNDNKPLCDKCSKSDPHSSHK